MIRVSAILTVSLLMAGFLLSSQNAAAGPRFSLVGLSNVAQLKVTQDGTVSSSDGLLGYGGGALIEFPLSGFIGVETGAVYAARQFGSSSLETRLQQVQVPLSLKFWLGNVFYVNAGGYLGVGLGQLRSASTDGAVSTYGFSDYNLKKTDLGVIAGIGASLPLWGASSLRLGGQFLQSVTNASSDAASTRKFTEIQGVVGLSFGGGRSLF